MKYSILVFLAILVLSTNGQEVDCSRLSAGECQNYPNCRYRSYVSCCYDYVAACVNEGTERCIPNEDGVTCMFYTPTRDIYQITGPCLPEGEFILKDKYYENCDVAPCNSTQNCETVQLSTCTNGACCGIQAVCRDKPSQTTASTTGGATTTSTTTGGSTGTLPPLCSIISCPVNTICQEYDNGTAACLAPDPCRDVGCPNGFHCESDGRYPRSVVCLIDNHSSNEPIPCADVVCPDAHHCEAINSNITICLPDGITTGRDYCDFVNCPTGFFCTIIEGLPGCLPLPTSTSTTTPSTTTGSATTGAATTGTTSTTGATTGTTSTTGATTGTTSTTGATTGTPSTTGATTGTPSTTTGVTTATTGTPSTTTTGTTTSTTGTPSTTGMTTGTATTGTPSTTGMTTATTGTPSTTGITTGTASTTSGSTTGTTVTACDLNCPDGFHCEFLDFTGTSLTCVPNANNNTCTPECCPRGFDCYETNNGYDCLPIQPALYDKPIPSPKSGLCANTTCPQGFTCYEKEKEARCRQKCLSCKDTTCEDQGLVCIMSNLIKNGVPNYCTGEDSYCCIYIPMCFKPEYIPSFGIEPL
ncbi:hypothetical protein CYY_005313 [Polysphondylium violaceum]|uniref:Follistatin-like domain-containing protein n=1 Tax=Polysphondylium violaceum TaxID=133409 RepID=A0A8J4PRZ4_9MYCE|nr:hypothetical protein CYY_005313 [Polysphondylium violaceum]